MERQIKQLFERLERVEPGCRPQNSLFWISGNVCANDAPEGPCF